MFKHLPLQIVTLICFLLTAIPTLASPEFWIDVRDPDAYAADHLESAINLPLSNIADNITSITSDKNAEIHLYCRSGRRAGKAEKILQALGYHRAKSVGGIKDARKLKQKSAE